MTIIGGIKLFQKQITYTIETVNELEDSLGLSNKLEFDVKRIFPLDSLKMFYILEKCHFIDSFFKHYEISMLRIKLKKTEQMSEVVNKAKANSIDSIHKETNQVLFPKAPSVKEDNNKTQLGIKAANALNWRLHEFFQELSQIEIGLFIVEYDEVPISANKNRFFEKFVTDLEELVRSENQLNYFKTNIVHLHNCMYITKADMKRIGEKLGIKLNKKALFRVYSNVQYLSSINSFEELFQEVYEDFSSLKYDLKRLLEFDGNGEGTLDMEQEAMSHKEPEEMEQETMPRAPLAPSGNADSTENLNSKSDMKNCLTYVKNQCGKHTLNQMAELLKIGRATFFRKIKGQNTEPINKGNKDCEFCLRKGANINDENDVLPSPTTPVITDEMFNHLINACNGHKVAQMARSLNVNQTTLRKFMDRKNIVITNNDTTKCYFCGPRDNSR